MTATAEQRAIALGDLEAAGLPRLVWSDGPNGIRGANGATAFPSSTALAASFDRDLARRFGEALAREALAAGRNAMLAPGLDLARVPTAGRVAENLGEDPLLTGELGGHVAAGLQSGGVLAVAKHFVANNFEHLRTGRGPLDSRSAAIDVVVSDRALHELYAAPFRRVLVEHGAGGVLGSYNRLNGVYACEHPELYRLLRDEWGWDGLTVPDFLFAVRDAQRAFEAGLDLPGLDELAGRTAEMVAAASPDLLAQIERHVRTAISRASVRAVAPTETPIDDADSRRLAEEILIEGSVLLRNDGLLPFTAADASKVALVGVDDPSHLLVMGGAASVSLSPARIPRLADELEAAGFDLVQAAGTSGDTPLPPLAVPTRIRVSWTDGRSAAFDASEFGFDAEAGGSGDWRATATATWVPTTTGRHRIVAEFSGVLRLRVDGIEVLRGFREASPMIFGPEYVAQAVVDVEAGTPVELVAEYDRGPAIEVPGRPIGPHLRVGAEPIDDRISAAAAAAAGADVAVVVLGRVAGEAMDLETLRLPRDQELLLERVVAANPRTVAVICAGGPVVLPSVDGLAAALHVWHPGERFAPGLVRMLTGLREPGGRLPLTFPRSDAEAPVRPPASDASVRDQARYDEELLVGYRWYDETDVAPAYPFGFGLGYTTFDVATPSVRVEPDAVIVSARVTNTGARPGGTVLQAYITSPAAARRPRSLAGFTRVRLAAGESTTVELRVPIGDLRVRDVAAPGWTLVPGRYLVEVGWSSRDLPGAAPFTVGTEPLATTKEPGTL